MIFIAANVVTIISVLCSFYFWRQEMLKRFKAEDALDNMRVQLNETHKALDTMRRANMQLCHDKDALNERLKPFEGWRGPHDDC